MTKFLFSDELFLYRFCLQAESKALLMKTCIVVFCSLCLCRLLESQLQAQRRSHENEVEVLRGELQSVKEENNRQQQLLAQNLQLPPEARIEASLQHEITRLTNENLVRTNTLLTRPCSSGSQPTADTIRCPINKYCTVSLSAITYFSLLIINQ